MVVIGTRTGIREEYIVVMKKYRQIRACSVGKSKIKEANQILASF